MTLYHRMCIGEQIDWRWLYCLSCRMEWIVPDVDPDALPKFCCHCRNEIDPTIKPEEVLPDIAYEEPPQAYDLNATKASQMSHFELSPECSVRIEACNELTNIGNVEHRVISNLVTVLVNEWIVLTLRMSHHTLRELTLVLEDYVSTSGQLIAKGESILSADELRKFSAYTKIGERLE